MALPENVQSILEQVPWIDIEDFPDDQRHLYNIGRNNQCMTCSQDLGEGTLVTLSVGGIIAVHCSGVCFTDLHVVGWLQQRHEDIVERISARTAGLEHETTVDYDEPQEG